MADLLFVAVIIAFFAVCLLFVKACDRIIGPDEGQLDDRQAQPGTTETDTETEAVAR